MVRLLVSKVAARSSARCLPLPCSSSTIAKRRSVRFIYSSLPLLDCSLASPFSPSLPCSSLPYNLLILKSLFPLPLPAPKKRKRGCCRLGATAPNRQHPLSYSGVGACCQSERLLSSPETSVCNAGTYILRGNTPKRAALLSARRRRNAMRMQEPEQWQPSGQASQEYGEYRADYPGSYEPEQQQKVYPQKEPGLRGTALSIFAIILSSIRFFFTVACVVGSAIGFRYSQW